MRLRKIILAWFAMATGMGGLAGWSQTPSPAIQSPVVPTLKVYSREIVVDVSVTDSDGRPIRGLTKSDFTVAENGKPQPIQSFAESEKLPQATEMTLALGPGVYTNAQTLPETGPVNILLLDAFQASPEDIAYEKSAAMDYAKAMPTGTQLAIFFLSSSGLHMLQGFTSQPAMLRQAVQNRIFEFNSNLIKWTEDWYTIDALNQIAGYVSRIKGRKNLIWFTHGMPIALLPDGGYGWADPEAGNGWAAPDMGQVNRLMDAYELLTNEQVAVYPVDPRGVVGLGMESMRADAVAEALGGEAYYNNNDLSSAIADAIDHGSHFYTLSYFPPKQRDDGHFHTIKIAVGRPGMHLVYRKGYNAEQPRLRAAVSGAGLMKAALEAKVLPATQLLFDVEVLPSTQASKPNEPPGSPVGSLARKYKKASLTRFELQYTLDASQIALADGADGTHGGSLEFCAAAYTNSRKLVTNSQQTVALRLTNDDAGQFAQTPYQFTQQVELPPGQVYLRVGILDRMSNKVGTLEIPLNVPKSPGQALATHR